MCGEPPSAIGDLRRETFRRFAELTTQLLSTSGEPHESITDHQTKALRPDDGTRDRAATILHYRGPFRIYFKPSEEYPRVVSIDNGSHAWEILCKSVKIESLALKTTKHPTNDYPIALEGFGWVQVDANGAAVIS